MVRSYVGPDYDMSRENVPESENNEAEKSARETLLTMQANFNRVRQQSTTRDASDGYTTIFKYDASTGEIKINNDKATKMFVKCLLVTILAAMVSTVLYEHLTKRK